MDASQLIVVGVVVAVIVLAVVAGALTRGKRGPDQPTVEGEGGSGQFAGSPTGDGTTQELDREEPAADAPPEPMSPTEDRSDRTAELPRDEGRD